MKELIVNTPEVEAENQKKFFRLLFPRPPNFNSGFFLLMKLSNNTRTLLIASLTTMSWTYYDTFITQKILPIKIKININGAC